MTVSITIIAKQVFSGAELFGAITVGKQHAEHYCTNEGEGYCRNTLKDFYSRNTAEEFGLQRPSLFYSGVSTLLNGFIS